MLIEFGNVVESDVVIMEIMVVKEIHIFLVFLRLSPTKSFLICIKYMSLQIPEHIMIDLHYYLWKDQIKQLHQQFDRIFIDLQEDGRLWIKEPFLYREPQRIEGAMLAFNFRQTNNPQHRISISRITKSGDIYQRINHDYVVFRNHLNWQEFIHHPLPKRYLFSSGLDCLFGYK